MGRSHTRWLLRLTIVSALLWRLPAAKDNIAPGELVRDADSLISADGMYRLGFFTPAGSSNSRYLGIWFNTVPVLTVIWVANRDRPISHSTGGGVLSISGNGTLVLADAKGTVYWSTGSAVGVVNPVARLLNTSNFVVTGASDGDSSYAWQSFDYPTDSVVSGMKLGWSRSTGKNRTASSWKSSDDPAPGEYTIAVDVRGDPQFFLMRGTARIWRSGPWMGERFTGVPEIAAYKTWFKVGFSNDDHEVGFWYDVVNRSVLSRLVVHPTGVAERLVWNENTQTWNRYWAAPKDPCDFWGTCGPFGVCDTSDSPICRCMQGFVPRRPENWIYNEGTEGCVRRTPLDCRNGTDGFVKVAPAKLPDTSAAVVNYTMGLEDCRVACLRNCSCAAYASAVVAGSGDRGCIHWSGNVTDTRVNPNGGEDLFVRLAVADLASAGYCVQMPSSLGHRSARQRRAQ